MAAANIGVFISFFQDSGFLEGRHRETDRKYHPVDVIHFLEDEQGLKIASELDQVPSFGGQRLLQTSECSFHSKELGLIRADMWAPTSTNTVDDVCCSESRSLLDFSKERNHVSLRPDVIALGFNQFDESFDTKRILCIYTESETDDAVELMFFHVEGMATIFGVGLSFSIVKLTRTGELEIRQVGELLWVQPWIASSVQSGNLALFDDSVSQSTSGSSFTAVELSAQGAAELFGVGVDGMRYLLPVAQCQHSPGDTYSSKDIISPQVWMKSLFDILKGKHDLKTSNSLHDQLVGDPKMADSDATMTEAGGARLIAGSTSGSSAEGSGQANLPSQMGMLNMASEGRLVNQPKIADPNRLNQDVPNDKNLIVIIRWNTNSLKFFCHCDEGHQLVLQDTDSRSPKIFDPISHKVITGSRNIVACELAPTVKVEFIYGSDQNGEYGDKRFTTTLNTVFYNIRCEPQDEVFGWYHDSLRLSFGCKERGAVEQEVDNLDYEVLSELESRNNGGVHREEASSSSKRSTGQQLKLITGMKGVVNLGVGLIANQEGGTTNTESQSCSNQVSFNCLKETNFSIHRESKIGELAFMARLFPPLVSYNLNSLEGRQTAYQSGMMSPVPIKVRGKWLVLEDESHITPGPRFSNSS